MKIQFKGWLRLTIQIGLLSISMIIISFFTETDVWLEHFNSYYPANMCTSKINPDEAHAIIEHYHWNYRGVVYVLTGSIYFIMSCIRIGISHKEEDFKLN